jgi:Ca-activated chloride channel family protein
MRMWAAVVCLFAAAASLQGQDGSPATFQADARLVVLHATVTDKDGKLVTSLSRQAFRAYEDGKEQQLKFFRREDVPVSMGIIIDNSASMKNKRQKVDAAAEALVNASNRQDEVFLINFDDGVYRDVDFTSDLAKLSQGLGKIDCKGGTAMRDALLNGIRYAKAKGKHDKKVLVVVTDGDDTMSEATLDEVLREAQQQEILIYAVALLAEEERDAAKRARQALDQITRVTGGHVWYPKDPSEVSRIALQVAHDIRNQYILAYTPANPALDGSYRKIRLSVNGPGGPKARTRTGYYATADLGARPAIPKPVLQR